MAGAIMTRQLQRMLLIMAALGLLGSQFATAADEVVLRSTGESVQGTIANITKTGLEVEQTGKSAKIPVTDIAEIRWDGEPPELNITRIRERNGEYAEALKSYESLIGGIDAAKTNLKTDVQFLIARTLAQQAMTDPAKKDAAVKALNDFITSNANSIRYYDAIQWLGKVQLAADEFGPATVTYQRLAGAAVPELKMAGQNALGRVKLKQEDYAGALAEFDKVLKAGGSGPAALRQQFAAELGKALVLQQQGDHEGALKTLDDVIAKASADDTEVQAEAFVRKGASLQALGKTQEALLAFLHVDILFAGQPEPHAESLFHLTKLWETVGKAERSAQARRTLTTDYPASTWAKQL